ncbi:MAG TPA: bifunctional phosphoribosyl-AMP cyclohydrolase/phosphoribosyl-ATP diphosphatase HisIE, partial [Bacteroidales bacterium]|nr:bifunctional phosphoribosyl-AMP cyclohydrolase/phosphoribosyl-ATP diphosphatase HisIE [Bacteroidales bacterium]
MDINFNKLNGLVPVVVQDWKTLKVLMVGFMNREAYEKTVSEGYVTFYSRSRQELWTKGQTSGNYLKVKDMAEDCDQDSLLILAEPYGNVCHTGRYSCFDQKPEQPLGFLSQLEKLLRQRKKEMPEGSYTAKLFDAGINKIAQKVGEEAVELVIEAKDTNRELLLNEGADLIYHLLVLLVYKDYSLRDIVQVLEARHS